MTQKLIAQTVPELIVSKNNKKIFHIPLTGESFSIGRSTENDLILTGDEVSRQHAILHKNGAGHMITDVSRFGMTVNNAPLQQKQPLNENDNIRIADWLLTYEVSSAGEKNREETRATQLKSLRPLKADLTKVLSFTPDNEGFQFLRPLLLIDDAVAGKSHANLRKKTLVVGTSPQCDIVLKDDFVSKMHAEFCLSDQGFLVRDLGSTNGTFIAGAKIKEKYVGDKEVLSLGRSTITVTFEKSAREAIRPFKEDIFCGLIGISLAMKTLFKKVQIIAPTDMTVLIHGETGTGKELFARAIHDLSPRAAKPFVVINCGAISPQLIESELFGHEKGAFTGAEKQHRGVFEQASSGTLFLDEIGELPLELQSKLLRAIEYQTFRRVGGTEEIRVAIRLIAATHQDLSRMVGLGQFREDLFFRLSVLPVTIPSLRERKEDIAPLVKSFLTELSPSGAKVLSPQAAAKLQAHTWPGNVRELRNTLMRALTFCQGDTIEAAAIEIISVIQPAFLDEREVSFTALLRARNMHDDRDMIVKTLNATGGDKSRTARLLGVGRSTLFRRIKDFNIDNIETGKKKE